MPWSPRPLVVALLTAVTSIALLALAIGQGWLGPDTGRGAWFCEAARDGLVLQPANTFSNAGFVIAGLLVAWQAGFRDRLGDVLPTRPGLATAYGAVVVLLGPASSAMHATQSAAGETLDLTSMYLVSSFAAGYALTRWLRRDRVFFWQVFLLSVAACELIGRVSQHVPVVVQSGNVGFAALLVTAVVLEVRLWRRGPERTRLAWGAAAVGTLLLAFTIWNLDQHGWCDPHSLVQGHAIWHVLCAVSAWMLFRLWASERAEPSGWDA